MSDFTFLTKEQFFGELDILKERGAEAAITDFSILLGGRYSKYAHIDNDSSLEGRTGEYWTKSDIGDNEFSEFFDVYMVEDDGSRLLTRKS